MIANQEIELKDNSSVKLRITVGKDSIRKEYDELVQKYKQSAQMKGFRRGKVPADILIRKFGDVLQAETTEKVIQKSLDEALKSLDKQPLPYAMPRVDSADPMSMEKDYTYEVTFDVFPQIELGEYKGLEYEELAPEITDEDVGRELQGLQEKNSFFVDKADGKVEKGSVANIDYVELDAEGNEIAARKRDSFVFEIGTGYNLYKLDDELIGMGSGEEKVIRKSYPADFEIKDLAGREVTVKVKVNSVKEKKLPELNDELAQDISEKYKTLQDLKDDITTRLRETARARVREHNISQLLDKIVTASKIPLPESMIEVELASQWENFLAQYRMQEEQFLRVLKQQSPEKGKAEVLAEWRPAAERKLKLLLAVDALGKKEEVTVSEEELNAEIQKQADASKLDFKEAKERLEKNRYLDHLRDDLKTEKTYDRLLQQSMARPGKAVKFLDLVQGNY